MSRGLSSSSSLPYVQSAVHRGKVWEVRDHGITSYTKDIKLQERLPCSISRPSHSKIRLGSYQYWPSLSKIYANMHVLLNRERLLNFLMKCMREVMSRNILLFLLDVQNIFEIEINISNPPLPQANKSAMKWTLKIAANHGRIFSKLWCSCPSIPKE